MDCSKHTRTGDVMPCDAGDIVFLTSDGVADNFDPVIMKTARRAPYASEVRDRSVAAETALSSEHQPSYFWFLT